MFFNCLDVYSLRTSSSVERLDFRFWRHFGLAHQPFSTIYLTAKPTCRFLSPDQIIILAITEITPTLPKSLPLYRNFSHFTENSPTLPKLLPLNRNFSHSIPNFRPAPPLMLNIKCTLLYIFTNIILFFPHVCIILKTGNLQNPPQKSLTQNHELTNRITNAVEETAMFTNHYIITGL